MTWQFVEGGLVPHARPCGDPLRRAPWAAVSMSLLQGQAEQSVLSLARYIGLFQVWRGGAHTCAYMHPLLVYVYQADSSPSACCVSGRLPRHGAEYVCESTGVFLTTDKARRALCFPRTVSPRCSEREDPCSSIWMICILHLYGPSKSRGSCSTARLNEWNVAQ